MRTARLLFATLSLGATFAITEQAQAADLSSCGDFFFDPGGDVQCEVKLDVDCDASCEPLAFEVECAAELYLGCEGGCDLDIDVECTLDCEAGCNVDCEGGEFDCRAYCEGGCFADCESRCTGDANETQCRSSCEAGCNVECGASCEVELPDCEASCQASCEGGCQASANADCQIECQADGYIDCEAELQGGCEIACETPEGALFCDGQWINTDDLESCADAIIESFDIEIDGYARADCEGNTCTAEAGCTTKCATAAPSTHDSTFGMMALGVATLGLAAARRRRRSR
ncbi:MAG: hypothetical protein IPM79_32895 [Polyangiaceae bacterium]|nr:hypothetical protein [Polyangiaceae bacterium]MBK8942276.1 hypothetical protein [Polyangiaceae bacterium]